MRTATRAAAASVLVVATAAVAPAGATPRPVTAPALSRADLAPVNTAEDQYAVQIRERNGFNADLNHVRIVASDPNATTADLGTPLDTSEQAEMHRRHELLTRSPALEAVLTKAGINFGGSWLDNRAGGVLHVATTAAVPRDLKSIITGLLPEPSLVVYSISSFTLDELNKVNGLLAADGQALQGLNVNITTSSTDVQSSKIDVTVLTDSANATKVLEDRYGSGLFAITQDDAKPDFQLDRNFTTGRLYGGEWISTASDQDCTAGFANAQVASNPTHRYLITAGHCASSRGWYQGYAGSGGSYFGYGGSNGFYNSDGTLSGNSPCDCQRIGAIDPPDKRSPKVLVDNNDLFEYHRTGYYSDGDYRPGDVVCTSGAQMASTYGRIRCGAILSGNANLSKNGTGPPYVTSMVKTDNAYTDHGDSGAPVGLGTAYLGVHSAGLDGIQYFSPASQILGVTGAKPIYDS